MTLENAMFLLSVKCMTTVHVVTQLYMYVTRFGNVTRITVWIIFKKIKSQFCLSYLNEPLIGIIIAP